jgi:predicted DNA-binding transcriptional regulator AlpA
MTTLNDLSADPTLAKSFSPEEATEMLAQLVVVQGVLWIQAASGRESRKEDVADRLLTVEEAAEILSVSNDWLYHNARTLPFACKLSSGQLRFKAKGLGKYIKNLVI